jgi:hypothetical protein
MPLGLNPRHDSGMWQQISRRIRRRQQKKTFKGRISATAENVQWKKKTSKPITRLFPLRLNRFQEKTGLNSQDYLFKDYRVIDYSSDASGKYNHQREKRGRRKRGNASVQPTPPLPPPPPRALFIHHPRGEAEKGEGLLLTALFLKWSFHVKY